VSSLLAILLVQLPCLHHPIHYSLIDVNRCGIDRTGIERRQCITGMNHHCQDTPSPCQTNARQPSPTRLLAGEECEAFSSWRSLETKLSEKADYLSLELLGLSSNINIHFDTDQPPLEFLHLNQSISLVSLGRISILLMKVEVVMHTLLPTSPDTAVLTGIQIYHATCDHTKPRKRTNRQSGDVTRTYSTHNQVNHTASRNR